MMNQFSLFRFIVLLSHELMDERMARGYRAFRFLDPVSLISVEIIAAIYELHGGGDSQFCC